MSFARHQLGCFPTSPKKEYCTACTHELRKNNTRSSKRTPCHSRRHHLRGSILELDTATKRLLAASYAVLGNTSKEAQTLSCKVAKLWPNLKLPARLHSYQWTSKATHYLPLTRLPEEYSKKMQLTEGLYAAACRVQRSEYFAITNNGKRKMISTVDRLLIPCHN